MAEDMIAAAGGTFTTAAGDTCFRWRGTSEAVTAALVETALRLAPGLARPGAPWLSGHELAPCHWFARVHDQVGSGTRDAVGRLP